MKGTEKKPQKTGEDNCVVKATSSRPLLMPPPPPPRVPIQQKPTLKLEPNQQLHQNSQQQQRSQKQLPTKHSKFQQITSTAHTKFNSSHQIPNSTAHSKFHKMPPQVKQIKQTKFDKSTDQRWNTSNVDRLKYRLPLKPTIPAKTSPAGVDCNFKTEAQDSFRFWKQLTAAARKATASQLMAPPPKPLHGNETDAEPPISQLDIADVSPESDMSTSGQAPDKADDSCAHQNIKEEQCSESESEEFEADYGTDEDHADSL
jgi:hypothetical protein